MLNFDCYYHIYNHANGSEDLFREQKNYDYFLRKYYHYINPIAETISWCLMPNHFHLLVKIKTEQEVASTFPKFQTLEKLENKTNFLSKQFSNFFSSYTQSYNKIYNRKGSLFLKNFKRKEIKEEEYLRKLIIYIHNNPVKHGFSEDVKRWKHSSYKYFHRTELMKELFNDELNSHYLHQLEISDFDELFTFET